MTEAAPSLAPDVVELAAYVPAAATVPLREMAFRRDAWSTAETARLRQLFFADEPLQVIADDIGRKLHAVRTRVCDLGLRRNSVRAWTDLEDAELVRRYPAETGAAIAQDLGRGVFAIYARAQVLGLSEPGALPYTAWEDLQLRTGYATGVPVTQIAALIGRPLFGVSSRASVLGLRHASTPADWTDPEVARMLELATQGVRYLKIIRTLAAEGYPERTLSALKGAIWKTGYRRGWGRPWTPDEDELVRRAYQDGASVAALTGRLGRQISSIRWRAGELGLRGTHKNRHGFRQGPDWTPAEEAKLRREYGLRRPAEIAKDLERPVTAIYTRANNLGLHDPTRRRYSDDEHRAIRAAAAHAVRLKDLAKALDRSAASLSKVAQRMGLDFADPQKARRPQPDLTLPQLLALGEPESRTAPRGSLVQDPSLPFAAQEPT